MLTIKKAITIRCWDVLYNGVVLQRCDRRWEAVKLKKRLERLL